MSADDIVVRLRELHRHTAPDAADRIESLGRRVVALETELRDMRSVALEAIRWHIACPEDAEHTLEGLLSDLAAAMSLPAAPEETPE